MIATPDTPRGLTAAGSDDSSPLWLLVLVMALIIVPLIALSQVLAYWRSDVVDDQMFGYFGWRIAHGATVYLDVWDNKPPGIYWINALGMSLAGGSYLGVIAVCAAALVVAHAAFFVAAAAVYQRGAAALITILFSFYITHGFYTGGTNRTETFLVAFELMGVALYLRGYARDQWWKWYLAGACCGTAFLFKQVGLAGWGCMGLHLIVLVLMRALPWTAGLRRALLLLVGVATPVVLAGTVLAAQGALSAALFATFTFNHAYFATGDSQFPYSYVSFKLLKQHVAWALFVPLMMAAIGVVHAFLWWLRPQYRPPEIEAPLRAARPVCPNYMLFFAVWSLVAWYGALMSPNAYRHYLVPTIPPMLLLAGYLINVLRAEVRLLRRIQRRAWVLTAFVVLGYFALDALSKQFDEVSKVWVFRIDPLTREPLEWESIGQAVVDHTAPGDRIQCFGYMPGVYLNSRRLNATRFTTTEKVGQVGDNAQFVVDEIEARLPADPPALIVMLSSDFYWMAGRVPGSPRSRFQLGPWLLQNYVLVEEVTKFNCMLFKRRDLLRPDEPPLTIVYPDAPESAPAGGAAPAPASKPVAP